MFSGIRVGRQAKWYAGPSVLGVVTLTERVFTLVETGHTPRLCRGILRITRP